MTGCSAIHITASNAESWNHHEFRRRAGAHARDQPTHAGTRTMAEKNA